MWSRSLNRALAAATLAGAVAVAACDESTDPLAPAEEGPLPAIPLRPSFSLTQAITVVDLGTLGSGSLHVARAINNRNEVVGISSDAQDNARAFLWTRGSGMVDLGTTGGAEARANAINDQGVVVGMSLDAGGLPEVFRWSRSLGMEALGRFGGFEATAFGVNNKSQIVGRYTPFFDPMDPTTFRGVQAFIWGPSSGFAELPTLGTGVDGFAFDINDAGQVAGVSAVDPTAPFSGYLWTSGSGTQPLGTLGPNFSEQIVFTINKVGRIAGGAFNDVDSTFHPITWTPQGGFTNLKSLGFPAAASGFGIDVNLFGQLAVLILETTGVRTPAVWVSSTGVVTLPTLGGTDGEIWGINDLGVIVGWSENGSGAMRPAIWVLEFSSEDRIQDAMNTIDDLIATSSDPAVQKELNDANQDLQDAMDALNQTPPDVRDAVKELGKAVKDLEDAVKDGLDPVIANALMEMLAEAGRALAVDAIDAAIARGGDPGKIADAQQSLADGDALRAAGDYEGALKEYEKAVKDAEKA